MIVLAGLACSCWGGVCAAQPGEQPANQQQQREQGEQESPAYQLAYAAYMCDVEKVRALLDSGVSAKAKEEESGATALDAAILRGCDEVVGMLLAAGADRWHRSEDGTDALDLARIVGSPVLPEVAGWYAQALLDGDPAGKPAAERHGITMLMAHAWAGDMEEVRKIVDAVGVHPESGKINVENAFKLDKLLKAGDDAGWTPLHWACAGPNDHPDLVALLDAAANRQDDNEMTPLMLAAAMGHEQMVKALIASGADAAASRETGGGRATALDDAAWQGDAAVVRTLLDAMKTQSNEWVTQAAHLAARRGNTDAARALLDAGTPIEHRTVTEGPLLMEAVRRGDEALVRDLLDRGASVYGQDSFGWSVFEVAAKANRADIFTLLLDASGAPGRSAHKRENLQAALRGAAYYGRADMVRQCLAAGADPNAQSAGYLPITSAIISKDIDTLKVLIDAGADLTAHDSHGTSALDFARQCSKATNDPRFVEVIKVLEAHTPAATP